MVLCSDLGKITRSDQSQLLHYREYLSQNFSKSTFEEKYENLKKVGIHKTWALLDGIATTIAPEISKKKSVLWTGQIPFVFLDDQLLVRNVGLSSQGKLDTTTLNLAAKLKLPHHVGA